MSEKKDLAKVLNIVSELTELYTTKEVIEKLEVVRNESKMSLKMARQMYFSEIFNFIIEHSLKAYGVEEEKIYKGRIVNDVLDARNLIIFLAKDHTILTEKVIAERLGKSQPIIRVVMNDKNGWSERIPSHREMMKHYKEVGSKVESFKEELKIKYQL